jgi:5'-methylthioinosine phosphorylase
MNRARLTRVALIGGTGSAALVAGRPVESLALAAGRWGQASAPLLTWRTATTEVLFLARHGHDGRIPPHRVNYRANIAALAALEPDAVVGLNAVGGITPAAIPGRLVIPHQLIDYTHGREHTFFDGGGEPLQHVEFDPPFDPALRAALLEAACRARLDVLAHATYGCTQGPRLETAAEIDRLAADGCDLVGMTAMPEAALAREAGLAYAICAVVVNPAAGRIPGGVGIHAEIARHLDMGFAAVQALLQEFGAAG